MIGNLIMVAIFAAASSFRPLPDSGEKTGSMAKKQDGQTHENGAEGRSGLPYAFGRNFHTLDEYLLHLQHHAGPVGLPWWRQVAPDRFEHIKGKRLPATAPELATRAELLQRFGFPR